MVKIPKDVLDTLHWLRATQSSPPAPNDPFFAENSVVLLTTGTERGDYVFLGLDGRVFVFDREAGGVRETTDPRILAGGLRLCARLNELPELLRLAPPLPKPEAPCERCGGDGLTVFEWGLEIHTLVCYSCRGLGWQRPL